MATREHPDALIQSRIGRNDLILTDGGQGRHHVHHLHHLTRRY